MLLSWPFLFNYEDIEGSAIADGPGLLETQENTVRDVAKTCRDQESVGRTATSTVTGVSRFHLRSFHPGFHENVAGFPRGRSSVRMYCAL